MGGVPTGIVRSDVSKCEAIKTGAARNRCSDASNGEEDDPGDKPDGDDDFDYH